MKGLMCNVYEPPGGGLSNGGISSYVTKVCLVGEKCEVFEAREDMPAVHLIRRIIGGRQYVSAEPIEQPKGMCGPMFGGSFIYTSDSRFPNDYPIPLHDRFETQEQSDILSR